MRAPAPCSSASVRIVRRAWVAEESGTVVQISAGFVVSVEEESMEQEGAARGAIGAEECSA